MKSQKDGERQILYRFFYILFLSGGNCGLENYSLDSLVLLPRKIRRNCFQRTVEIIWNLENINLKENRFGVFF